MLTIYLECDIDFSEIPSHLAPIGNMTSRFEAVDGQGHVFSNLKVNSSSSYVGVFGYITDFVKNLVIDDSCSILTTGNNFYNYVGGIAGYARLVNTHSAIDNCVNMTSITYT